MQVLVIGGMSAGTKAAAKIKREWGRKCRVTLIEKGYDITAVGCALPYYIGGVVGDYGSLFINTKDEFEKSAEVELQCGVEALSVNRAEKYVAIKYLHSGERGRLPYDKLVLAVGASPKRPPIAGIDLPGVYSLRTPEDAEQVRQGIEQGVKRAVILGGGPIGLELAENLKLLGIRPVIIDSAPQILPGFDPEFAEYVENTLAENGIPCFTGESVEAIEGDGKVEVVRTASRKIKAQMVLLAVGVSPNTAFLSDSGLQINANGAIVVDEWMRTNDPDIYAVGDCAMLSNYLTGKPAWQPLGSVAAVTGRACGLALIGEGQAYPGVLGTTLVRTEGVNVGKTGLTLAAARDEGMDVVEATTAMNDKVQFYPDADIFVIRLVADKKTHRLLGVQVAGKGAVDKILDIAVTAIYHNATLESMQYMDLGYAPSFSTAVHPLVQAINVLLNKVQGKLDGVAGNAFEQLPGDTLYLDVMKTATLRQFQSMPVKTIHGPIDGIEKDRTIALLCEKGKQGYLAQRKLKDYGYTHTVVLEGGVAFHKIENENE